MTALGVLLVEDDVATAEMIARVLAPWGDALSVQPSPSEAMDARGPFDVAVVDVAVHQGAGMALMHFLRARDPQLPVVALTPAGDAEAEMVASALGVNATVSRPLTGDALLVALSPVRERKAARLVTQAAGPVRGNVAPLFAAQDLASLAHSLCAMAAELTGGAVRVRLEDARGIEVLAEQGTLPEGADEAVALAAFDEPLGTLHVARDAPLLREAAGRDAVIEAANAAASVGVLLRRVDGIARVGIKDPDTSAYTFSYFVDVAGREVERARRYGRRFALITFVIDDYATLASSVGADSLREARRELVDTILDAVRDSDVLAHVEDDELYLLVPESGMLGALACRRRIAERQTRRAELARLEGKASINVTIGVATYPRDGRDLTALLKAAHKRGNAARGGIASVVMKEHRTGLDATLGALLRFRPDDASWQLRQAAFPSEAIAAMASAVAREATRGATVRDGVMYILGDRSHPLVRGATDAVRLAPRGGTPAYWLRPASSEGRTDSGSGLNPVEIEVDAKRVGPFAILAVLTEGWAYACVASQHGEYKRVMHACELELVEALVAQIQTAFHLQKGIE